MVSTQVVVAPDRDPAPVAVVRTPALARGEFRPFVGHRGLVENVAFTTDGQRLITTGDKMVRIWDVVTGQELQRLEGHAGSVFGLAVLPDGHRIVTTSTDHTVRLWDLNAGIELKRYVGHTLAIWAASCDDRGSRFLTAESDKTIRLWNTNTAKEIKRLHGHEGRVTGVVFLPGGHRAVSASQDKTIRLWDVDAAKELRKVVLPNKIGRLTLSADGRRVLFGCGRTLHRWDPNEAMYETHVVTKGTVEGGASLPDGRVLIAVSDGTVRLWDVERDRELHTFDADGKGVVAIAVAPDGQHFAAVGKEGLARLWRLP
jgi:WD40 repeat protein